MLEFYLRECKCDDADSLAAAANNPNIANNLRNTFPSPYTIDDAKWFINDCIAREGKRQITRAIVIDGKAAGNIGITLQEDVFEKSGELGYWLAEEYWRNGITTEAVQRICKEAFTAFDIVRIYAEPFECNAGSRGVLEKAGFTYEGTMRNGVYKNGKILSYCLYSVLREEVEVYYGDERNKNKRKNSPRGIYTFCGKRV